MDKKTQAAWALVGFVISASILAAINKAREKKEREEMLKITKETEAFAEKLVNGMSDELWKKAEERVKQRHEEA